MKRLFSLLVLPLLIATTALAATYTVDKIPNVHLADSTRFVSDPDAILSDGTRTAIDAQLRNLMATTSAEVAVVTVDDVDQDLTSDDFATELFRHWGIGKKDNENGLLILVVKDRHDVVIRTGYGLEGLLPDGVCGTIIRSEILPRFRSDDFDGGVAGAVSALSEIIADPANRDEVMSRYANNARSGESDSDEFFAVYLAICAILAVGLFAAVIASVIASRHKPDYERYRAVDRFYIPALFCSFLGLGLPLIALIPVILLRKRYRRGPHPCPNCGTRMNLVDEINDNSYLTPAQDTEERINSIDYDVWLCPNCGATEIYPYVQKSSAFTECPHCHARALELVGDKVVRRPTATTEGVGTKIYRCRHCGKDVYRNYSIAKTAPAVVILPGGGGGRGFGGGGGFGGGSFGGGSTGGGGASGHW